MNEKLNAVFTELVDLKENVYLLRLEDGRDFEIKLPHDVAEEILCWCDADNSIKEVSYLNQGDWYSVNVDDRRKNGRIFLANKNLQNPISGNKVATDLEELPPLAEGFVRLKYRCSSLNVARILKNGLVFNLKSAGKNWGGTCRQVTEMASCYEDCSVFWKSMENDDFSSVESSKNADVAIVIDIPREEFDFLQQYGCLVYGRADSKYIVGVVPNYNSENKDLVLDVADVRKAKRISDKNSLPEVEVNDMSMLQEELRLRRQMKMEQVSI